MKIYTRGGDMGETSLFDGTQVAKSHISINLLGDIDELNAHLGLIHSSGIDDLLKDATLEIMNNLFKLSANLAGAINFKDFKLNEKVLLMEALIDSLCTKIPPLKNFIYPTGSTEVAYIHITRSVTRRVERRLIEFNEVEPIDLSYIKYMNRLSDLLFIMARYTNHKLGQIEEIVTF